MAHWGGESFIVLWISFLFIFCRPKNNFLFNIYNSYYSIYIYVYDLLHRINRIYRRYRIYRHCSKYFSCANSFNPHNNSMWRIYPFFPKRQQLTLSPILASDNNLLIYFCQVLYFTFEQEQCGEESLVSWEASRGETTDGHSGIPEISFSSLSCWPCPLCA